MTRSRNEPTEVLVAVHLDEPRNNARLVSINGESRRATWVPRKLTEEFALTGKTTTGTDHKGKRVTLPLANITIPEWLAVDRGFV